VSDQSGPSAAAGRKQSSDCLGSLPTHLSSGYGATSRGHVSATFGGLRRLKDVEQTCGVHESAPWAARDELGKALPLECWESADLGPGGIPPPENSSPNLAPSFQIPKAGAFSPLDGSHVHHLGIIGSGWVKRFISLFSEITENPWPPRAAARGRPQEEAPSLCSAASTPPSR